MGHSSSGRPNTDLILSTAATIGCSPVTLYENCIIPYETPAEIGLMHHFDIYTLCYQLIQN